MLAFGPAQTARPAFRHDLAAQRITRTVNRWSGASCSISATRCEFFDNGYSGLHLSMANGGTCSLDNCSIYRNGRQGVNHTGNSGSTVTIWNCTIANNGERGVFLQSSSTSVIMNSIIVFNDRGLHRNSGTMNQNYIIVFGNSTADFEGTSAGTWEVKSNPLFVGAWDFHLQAASPAIDAGADASAVTTVDLECGARPASGGWDMGSYEFGSSPPASSAFSVRWVE